MTLLKKHAVAIAAVCFYLLFLKMFNIGCPVKYLTGHTCPACGTTRALLSLARGDLHGYIAYNPFALPLGIALFCMLHLKFFRHKKAIELISVTIATVAVLRWLWLSF